MMPLDGLEIDMLSLGDADCILVTGWHGGKATRVLIDAGYARDVPAVLQFLQNRDITRIDHLVSTHPDGDHIGGLRGIVESAVVKTERVWLHRGEKHIGHATRMMEKTAAMVITASLQQAQSLSSTCDDLGVHVSEPFQGEVIGFLKVMSPSVSFYRQMLAKFPDREILLEKQAGQEGNELLPPTTPQNESSVVLATKFNDKVYLFTSDAGAQALGEALRYCSALADCYWMQIPHHGSRRNISEQLVTTFKPEIAYVSASGDKKHPGKRVIAAFQEAGAKVYGTHHPKPGSLWLHRGEYPQRKGYNKAMPLPTGDDT